MFLSLAPVVAIKVTSMIGELMRSTFKKRSPLSASNGKRLEELCAWISENSDQTLGWTQLTNKSGFSKEQLVELFLLFKQVTPIAFIRQVRLQRKNNLAISLQPELFENEKLLVIDKDCLT